MKAMMNVVRYLFGAVVLSVYAPIYIIKTYVSLKKAQAKNDFMKAVISYKSVEDVRKACYGKVMEYCYSDLGGYVYTDLGTDVLQYCYGDL